MPHYPTFLSLIESAILPLKRQHPNWLRLDGQTSGGNRNAFATFRYQYKTWVIHADTRFDKLLAAWELEKAGEKPFQVAETDGGNKCLRLSGAIAEADGLYIYLVE